jgi:hypothetical protein
VNTFGYRQDGLRTRKTSNGTVTTYLLNGDSVVKETTAGVSTDLLQGPGTDQPLSRGGKWFVPNHQGSAVALTDASGNVTQSYGYKPFGDTKPNLELGNSGPTRSPWLDKTARSRSSAALRQDPLRCSVYLVGALPRFGAGVRISRAVSPAPLPGRWAGPAHRPGAAPPACPWLPSLASSGRRRPRAKS